MHHVKSFFRAIGKVFRNLLVFILVLLLLGGIGMVGLTARGTSHYPIRYGAEITQAAKEAGLSPQLVAGVVRSESNFDAAVIASDGGKGLMQLMPDAVAFMSDRRGEKADAYDLLDPKTNLSLGTGYLSYLVGRYQSEDLAIVAYNAGMSNVDQWLKDGIITWEASSLSKIPNRIPREYVARVNHAQNIYETFYPEELPQDTKSDNLFLLAFRNLWQTIRHYFGDLTK